MNPALTPFLVRTGTTVLEAMRQLEATAQKILFVVDDTECLLGSLTDGDIRRWILAEGDLQGAAEQVCNGNPYQTAQDYEVRRIRSAMVEKNIGCIPVVNGENQIVDLLFWDDVFTDDAEKKPVRALSIPVVIMAGGRGTRLDPFTRILPKPLIPLGDKTVIEHIIDSFLKYGVSSFYISVNEKAKIIKSYFEELESTFVIDYIEEEQPLGTAGSLRYLHPTINGSLMVTNCDIIIDADYIELLDFHKASGDDITIVGSLKNYHIPYGICEIVNGGLLTKITEKPEYNFLVNTGMYVLRSDILSLIPENQVFHMTDLIERVQQEGGRVAVFPVSDKAWIDTGEWAEYRKALRQLRVDYD